MRYDRAVGRQGVRTISRAPNGNHPLSRIPNDLGWMWLKRTDFREPAKQYQAPPTRNYWNAGVNVAYGSRGSGAYGGDTLLKSHTRQEPTSWWSWLFGAVPDGSRITMEDYNRAAVNLSYGNTAQVQHEMGDLFNDIMGAVVPGWDARPDWMKKIVFKPDPNKILAAANKLAPNAGAQAIQAANAAGLDVYIDGPTGPILMTPEMAQGIYKGYPMYTKARGMVGDFFGAVPTWIWLAGAGGVVLLFAMKRK